MIKRFIYVEDGSIDLDELREKLTEDTEIIVYRQGSREPLIVEPNKFIESSADSVLKFKDEQINLLKTYFREIEKATRTKKRSKKVEQLFAQAYEDCEID